MCSLPLSSTFIAVLKPTPSRPPIRFPAGTAQRSKITSHGMRAALAHLAVELAEREARRVALDHERRNAAGALVRGIGARHHRENGGLGRIGDEALRAVEHVVIAVAPRGRRKRRRIRA